MEMEKMGHGQRTKRPKGSLGKGCKMKDNAPFNNPLKRTKRKEDKKKKTSTMKIVSQKVPPKEQEATESPPHKKQLNPQCLRQ
jgi:hypothetical protein